MKNIVKKLFIGLTSVGLLSFNMLSVAEDTPKDGTACGNGSGVIISGSCVGGESTVQDGTSVGVPELNAPAAPLAILLIGGLVALGIERRRTNKQL